MGTPRLGITARVPHLQQRRRELGQQRRRSPRLQASEHSCHLRRRGGASAAATVRAAVQTADAESGAACQALGCARRATRVSWPARAALRRPHHAAAADLRWCRSTRAQVDGDITTNSPLPPFRAAAPPAPAPTARGVANGHVGKARRSGRQRARQRGPSRPSPRDEAAERAINFSSASVSTSIVSTSTLTSSRTRLPHPQRQAAARPRRRRWLFSFELQSETST
jgi:hypothetical protein